MSKQWNLLLVLLGALGMLGLFFFVLPAQGSPQVALEPSYTTITADLPDPSYPGQLFTVTLQVTATLGTPTGAVTVTVEANPVSCTALLVDGAGECSLTIPAAGDYILNAAYSGDGLFEPSSDSEPHRVDGFATEVSITGDTPDPSLIGEWFTVTFTVASDFGVPTGNVDVRADPGAVGCQGTLEAGAGSCALSMHSPGATSLIASYTGDSQFAPGDSPAESHMVRESKAFLPLTRKLYCTATSYHDDFSDPNSGWLVYSGDSGQSEYVGGEFRVLVMSESTWWSFSAPTCALEYYTVEVDARWYPKANTGWGYGLVFGLEGDYERFYFFTINTDFQFYELYYVGPEGWRELTWGYSDAIKTGSGTNHLKVTLYRNDIIPEVNGVALSSVTDYAIEGFTYAGVINLTYADVVNADARFDNFSLVKLETSESEAASIRQEQRSILKTRHGIGARLPLTRFKDDPR